MKRFTSLSALQIICALFCMRTVATTADEQSAARLDEMRALAAATEIFIGKSRVQSPQLLAQPVFRYSDAPRRIADAALWAWTVDGRPVAIQKIESGVYRGTGIPRWTYCLASLTEDTITVEWDSGRSFVSSGPGVSFRHVPDPPVPTDSAAARRRQMKRVASQFRATTNTQPDGSAPQEMRLLPRPILEYTIPESDLPAGAIFGFTANGTNPDAFLIIDLYETDPGSLEWRYGIARMTTSAVEVRLKTDVVWSRPWVRPIPTSFKEWTFFFTDRETGEGR